MKRLDRVQHLVRHLYDEQSNRVSVDLHFYGTPAQGHTFIYAARIAFYKGLFN